MTTLSVGNVRENMAMAASPSLPSAALAATPTRAQTALYPKSDSQPLLKATSYAFQGGQLVNSTVIGFHDDLTQDGSAANSERKDLKRKIGELEKEIERLQEELKQTHEHSFEAIARFLTGDSGPDLVEVGDASGANLPSATGYATEDPD